MRTTIVIEEALAEKLKPLTQHRGLSHFINGCIREYFERRERQKQRRQLEKAYARASESKEEFTDWQDLELEDWPEW